MQISRAQIAANRAAWRTIPPEIRATTPDIVSRVQLNDCGLIAAVFERNGIFEIEGIGRCAEFGKLDDAENYAVLILAKHEGPC